MAATVNVVKKEAMLGFGVVAIFAATLYALYKIIQSIDFGKVGGAAAFEVVKLPITVIRTAVTTTRTAATEFENKVLNEVAWTSTTNPEYVQHPEWVEQNNIAINQDTGQVLQLSGIPEVNAMEMEYLKLFGYEGTSAVYAKDSSTLEQGYYSYNDTYNNIYAESGYEGW